MALRWVILGNPENRRVRFFQEALARKGQAPAEVIAWRAFLRAPEALGQMLRPGDVLRVESPGEDFEVERELLRWGREQTPAGSVRIDDPVGLTESRGRLLAPAQWLAGWKGALASVRAEVPPGCVVLQDPDDVALLFDKANCHALLQRCGLPVPRAIGPVANYAQLRAAMRSARMPRVFVKLRGGSSASGVVALETQGDRIQATTSLEVVEEGGTLALFNSLRVRRYTDEREVARLFDTLSPEGVHVERWVPKSCVDGRAFDLRVLAVAGKPMHTVVRTSESPMTNLHLGNARGDVRRIRARMGEAAWVEAMATVAEVADLFPRTLHLGVDVLLTAHRHMPVIAEVNAFGDLLPGVAVQGENTYDAEIAAVLEGGFPRLNSIRAALFDLDNTLVDRDFAMREALRARAAERGCDASTVDAAFVLHNEFGHRERRALCDALVADAPQLAASAEELEADLVARLPTHVRPRPEILAALGTLRARLRVAVVSNGGAALQRAKLHAAGLGALDAFISEEVGAEKPDPRLFQAALAGSDVPAAQSFFIGDDLQRDISGAAACGLRTCWLSRDRPNPSETRAEWICRDLDAALARLARWT